MWARRRAQAIDGKDGGFSLVELLVVIIVLGVLAGIAIPVFLSQRTKGYEAGLKTDLRTVANEVQSQNTSNEDYRKTTWKTAGTAAVANATITGAGQIVGDSTSVGLTPGDTITWIGSTQTSFCVKAFNSKATAPWYYTPASGISTTACTS
jgi:prepilin-type N-terminal cleavage/methylation domain-containing protein